MFQSEKYFCMKHYTLFIIRLFMHGLWLWFFKRYLPFFQMKCSHFITGQFNFITGLQKSNGKKPKNRISL